MAILSDPGFEFWYSPLLRMETILQPTWKRQKLELEFHDAYFNAARCYSNLNSVFDLAEAEMLSHGIGVLDAMHLAAAKLARCEILYTAEANTKPMFRTGLILVKSIASPPKKGASAAP